MVGFIEKVLKIWEFLMTKFVLGEIPPVAGAPDFGEEDRDAAQLLFPWMTNRKVG